MHATCDYLKCRVVVYEWACVPVSPGCAWRSIRGWRVGRAPHCVLSPACCGSGSWATLETNTKQKSEGVFNVGHEQSLHQNMHTDINKAQKKTTQQLSKLKSAPNNLPLRFEPSRNGRVCLCILATYLCFCQKELLDCYWRKWREETEKREEDRAKEEEKGSSRISVGLPHCVSPPPSSLHLAFLNKHPFLDTQIDSIL